MAGHDVNPFDDFKLDTTNTSEDQIQNRNTSNPQVVENNATRFVTTLLDCVKRQEIKPDMSSVILNQIFSNLNDYKVMESLKSQITKDAQTVKLEGIEPLFIISTQNISIFQKRVPTPKVADSILPPVLEQDIETTANDEEETDNDVDMKQQNAFPNYPETPIEANKYFWSTVSNKRNNPLIKQYQNQILIFTRFISQGKQEANVKSQIKKFLKTHRNNWKNKIDTIEMQIHDDVIALCNEFIKAPNISNSNIGDTGQHKITHIVTHTLQSAFKSTLVPFKDQPAEFKQFLCGQKIRIITNEMTYFIANIPNILQNRTLTDVNL